ncbi:spore germination protein [Paenibacillus mendelii]|uniref:Spore germination protein n=1 Tax=Paenibacillus mendelii TaxID=206163 RepID=A0ABV6JAA3_9BACL|nr:spore germination protein [Paenibacillus mendelii]MCQ6560793.1 spore germination protein [Paenibacillus mendelii]
MLEQERQVERAEWLREKLRGCNDVFMTEMNVGGDSPSIVTVLYCEGMINRSVMQQIILEQDGLNPISRMTPFVSAFLPGEDGQELFNYLFSGLLIVWEHRSDTFYAYNISNQPGRNPEESTMELSLKGPRDGFVEQIDVNAALVRKRLRTTDLQMERYIIGTASQTTILLLYMNQLADPKVVDEARSRLKNINIATLHGAAELEEIISDRSLSLFPLVDYIGRPDFVVQSLMNGRFAILVDGSPAALIAPANLSVLIKSPEDAHLPFFYVTFERLLRMFGLLIAICLPGFWIALLAFNTDQIPLPLLATVTMSRSGLPLSSQLELFLMMLMFELFREAGVRLPRPVGQTVTVVGGLIVGDAAIRAGLTSPTMLVVSAVTAVATFTLVNQSLNGTVTIIRIYIMFVSSLLGLFGFFVSFFSVLLYMCNLESFGMPYLKPVAPIRFRKLMTALLQLPWKFRAKKGGSI